MENLSTNQEETTTVTISEESCKVAQKLMAMYMSRSRKIDDNGNVLEYYTFKDEEREQLVSSAVDLLTKDVDPSKIAIIEHILGYESTVRRELVSTDENGDPKTITYETVVSAITGELRYRLTHALTVFRVAESEELLNS